LKSLGVGEGPGTIVYDLSAAPAVRYLAFCRWNQGGPILRVADPKAICR
jgi:hypothetical protein